MISEGATSCSFTNMSSQGLNSAMYGINEDLVTGASDATHCSSLLYSFSVLKDKFNHLQSLVSVLISPDHHHHHQSQPESATSMAMASINTLVQEVIVTASSMLFTCQQMNIGDNCANRVAHTIDERGGQGSYTCDQNLDWYADNVYNNTSANHDNNSQTISIYSTNTDVGGREEQAARRNEVTGGQGKGLLVNNCDIIELEASDILAKYTHYCQVCGKGFKRDANLRMHMRAHGDEYKSPAALTNPMKRSSSTSNGNNKDDDLLLKVPRKYSCPQEGCRWNRKHAKFQPLKSMICVKNHYKRSHCPKMYVCKRCNQKQFSVLSDLRTHEKHCGDLKWQCSCGTTFSRKDKLMGHVALFVGHTPAVPSSTTTIIQG